MKGVNLKLWQKESVLLLLFLLFNGNSYVMNIRSVPAFDITRLPRLLFKNEKVKKESQKCLTFEK